MLFEALFWSPLSTRPPLAEFRQHQEFSKLLADWGRPGDRGVIAEAQQLRIGAAWFRLWTPELHSYGFVDTPAAIRCRRRGLAMTSFRLAPMCGLIWGLTLLLLALPVVFLVMAFWGPSVLEGPALLLAALYVWVWLRFRPNRFVVHPSTLEVIWPLKHREIPRASISGVRLVDRATLRREAGWGLRVGAGGLWGGFGWLWTQRRGIVQMYVSRVDGLVWIERVDDRPWLITPEQPDAFVRALSR
jgi:Bacterial PH domain